MLTLIKSSQAKLGHRRAEIQALYLMNAKQRDVVLRGGTGENHEWLKFVAGVRTGKDQQKNCSMDMC
jgi:hypothetical protein